MRTVARDSRPAEVPVYGEALLQETPRHRASNKICVFNYISKYQVFSSVQDCLFKSILGLPLRTALPVADSTASIIV
ncbi:hypothetical protein FHG87_004605 [Trinorchestia longiramus]|nr:hypothetical protein FHG87_004605 [Trinorchestia longiramus]